MTSWTFYGSKFEEVVGVLERLLSPLHDQVAWAPRPVEMVDRAETFTSRLRPNSHRCI